MVKHLVDIDWKRINRELDRAIDVDLAKLQIVFARWVEKEKDKVGKEYANSVLDAVAELQPLPVEGLPAEKIALARMANLIILFKTRAEELKAAGAAGE